MLYLFRNYGEYRTGKFKIFQFIKSWEIMIGLYVEQGSGQTSARREGLGSTN